jgi:hypothetical protein
MNITDEFNTNTIRGVVNKLKANIPRSLEKAPCSEAELSKKDFLKHVSPMGVTIALNELLKEEIVTFKGGLLVVSEGHKDKYKEEPQSIFY